MAPIKNRPKKGTFGKLLLENRESLQRSREEIAVKLGVSASAVHHWENNRRTPEEQRLPAIAEEYSISLEELKKRWRELVKELVKNPVQRSRLLETRVSTDDLRWLLEHVAEGLQQPLTLGLIAELISRRTLPSAPTAASS